MNLIRTFPSENRHGNVVGTVQIPLHLRLQVREGIEAQIIVKPFLVVPMTPFHFSVMPRCPRSDQFVPDAVSVSKHIQGVDAACFSRMRKLPAVICLQDIRRVLSIVFRKIVSGKMKFCAGRSGEGAAKPRLGASEQVPAARSRVPRQRHSSE